MDTNKLNMLYDCLSKVELIEMVLKQEDSDLKYIEKVKEQIKDQLKRA